MSASKIRVALDWTPNTNHTGFYVALCQQLYAKADLEVDFILPQAAAAEGLTPARLVAAGKADLAVGPSESAISFATSEPDKPRLCAVAALLQGSTSCIACLSSSGVDRPAKLAGKRYASYVGRFEDSIVRQMVRNDGGDGSLVDCHPLPQHGYADEALAKESSVVATLLQKGLSDSTWIFYHWEGVLADRTQPGLLNYFALEDYGIPYGYSPILLAHPSFLEKPELQKFLKATAEGYAFAADPKNAEAAVNALLEGSGFHESLVGKEDFLKASLLAIAGKYLDKDKTWGRMEEARWKTFVNFLTENQIMFSRDGRAIREDEIDIDKLFTNTFL
eukprot:TRINITY_DN79786_c0_g1_i1.p1 TRINITY_DN79786_c0_g1~~TRINITY_DN79786_c0_g1_i1.p1  ORF type:complete len:334 (-),score=80.05 TRINITY_DN79786_c0_g1_i1:196-1197(-)